MKPFIARTIFILSARNESRCYGFNVSRFSSSSNHPFQSSSNSAAFRRHEEESRSVKVSVWWDFENCSPSAGGNIFKIAQNVTAAIRASGIKGPIQITAFGDMIQLSRANQEALSATGINLTHIPHGGKNSADRSLLVDLMYWVSQNPPPSHLFLISGDRDFANTLHRLRMNNYNILLAAPENSPSVLCSAASIMWNWNSLVKGDNLTGKYFNQPPDGPYGSWYGYYKVPLEDPFALNQQPSSSSSSSTQLEDLSDSCQEQKVRPVPKVVVKQIRRLLSAYPKGISITDLRAELGKTDVTLDKDLFGYKKFSRLLLSLPYIKLSGSDGCFYVRMVTPKVSEPVDGTSVSNSDEPNLVVSTKGNDKDNKMTISPEPPLKIEQKEVEPAKEGVINGVDDKLDMKMEVKVLGNSHEGTSEEVCPVSSSLSDNGEAKDGKVLEPSVFMRFIGWFMFWRTDPIPRTDISEDSCTIPKSAGVDDGDEVKNKIFSDDTFWAEMARFLNTSHGSDIVSGSRTREDIAETLKKEGPSALTSLSTTDLLHLLNLMITDKKWIQESIFEPYPFKLIKPVNTSKPKPSEKSRNEVLADCQKLADEIVNENPEGFNMGSFRKLFVERFGYTLDFQKLGYQKLTTLLQLIPGIKVENNFIYPATLRKESNDLDSQWEELGPVATKEGNDSYNPVEDESISDSEEETLEKSDKACGLNKEDSSLIRILDSWYSKNGDDGKVGGAESVDSVGFSGGNVGKKQRPMKTYSFVSDKEDGSRDKLIDGILCSLKKSGESSRLHS